MWLPSDCLLFTMQCYYDDTEDQCGAAENYLAIIFVQYRPLIAYIHFLYFSIFNPSSLHFISFIYLFVIVCGMVNWTTTIRPRVRAEEAISVDLLCSILRLLCVDGISIDVYTSVDQVDLPSCTHCARSSFFYHFFDLGGVVVSSPLSRKWHNRQSFLLDSNFWRLWDVIASSGWVSVSLCSFQSAYDCSHVQDLRFILLLPCSDSLNTLGLTLDELCSYSFGYDLFRDVLQLFQHFLSVGRWGFGSEFGPIDATLSQYIDYHIRLLELMIRRHAQPCDILEVVLEFNLWGVCHSSVLPYSGLGVSDDSFDSIQDSAMMLVLRSAFNISDTAGYCTNIMKHF